MTRFWLNYDQAINIIITALYGVPQIIYIPKAKTFLLRDLIRAFNKKIEYTGARPGEKVTEVLIDPYEALHTIDKSTFYEIMPLQPYDDEVEYYQAKYEKYINIPLMSNKNNMNVEEIRRLI